VHAHTHAHARPPSGAAVLHHDYHAGRGGAAAGVEGPAKRGPCAAAGWGDRGRREGGAHPALERDRCGLARTCSCVCACVCVCVGEGRVGGLGRGASMSQLWALSASRVCLLAPPAPPQDARSQDLWLQALAIPCDPLKQTAISTPNVLHWRAPTNPHRAGSPVAVPAQPAGGRRGPEPAGGRHHHHVRHRLQPSGVQRWWWPGGRAHVGRRMRGLQSAWEASHSAYCRQAQCTSRALVLSSRRHRCRHAHKRRRAHTHAHTHTHK